MVDLSRPGNPIRWARTDGMDENAMSEDDNHSDTRGVDGSNVVSAWPWTEWGPLEFVMVKMTICWQEAE